MPLDNKLSNILGVPLPPWLYNQLRTRSLKNGEQTRSSNDTIRYLEGKTAWVRLVSSVDITDEADKAHFRRMGVTNLNKDNDLAKQFILFAGTSKFINSGENWLRTGIYDPNKPNANPAYGILGKTEIEQFGYRPMPGITGVNIATQGRLGSVRAATINFKCWNRNQLDIIDALYFKLGYTMFLEWGHVNYFAHANSNVLQTSEKWMMNPFENNLDKETILSRIASNVESSEGNYDAMLGMTTNFNFSYNQEGGYDCQLKLMALGILADSTKINHTSTVPGILSEQIKLYKQAEEAARLQAEAAAAAEKKSRIDNIRKTARNVTQNDQGELIITNPASAWNGKTWDAFLKEYSVTEDELKSYGIEVGSKTSSANFSTEEIINLYDKEITVGGEKIKSSDYYYSYGYGSSTDNEKSIWFGNRPNAYTLIRPRGGTSVLIQREKTDGKIDSSLRVQLNSQVVSNLINRTTQEDVLSDVNKYTFTYVIEDATGANAGKKFYFGLSMPQRVYVIDPENGEVIVDDPKAKDTSTDLENNYEELNHTFVADGTYDYELNDFLKDVKDNVPKMTWSFADYSFYSSPTKNESGFPDSSSNAIAAVAKNSIISRPGFYRLEGRYRIERKFKQKESGAFKTLTLEVRLNLTSNDINLIQNISQVTEDQAAAPQPETVEQSEQVEQGEQQNKEQSENPDAKKSPLANLSAIEIALRAIQVHSLVKSLTEGASTSVFVASLTDPNDKMGDKTFLEQMFDGGIFSSYITQLAEGKFSGVNEAQYREANSDLRAKINAQYGFAANLLANRRKITDFKPVDYTELLKSYVLPYEINQSLEEGTQVNHPVYISLGFFLTLINNNCVIYDTGKDGKKTQTPLSYIDFNPEHNFCLSLREHLSTDPFTALIPFEGQDEDFKRIFDPKVVDGDYIKAPSVAPEQEGEDSGQTKPVPTLIWKPRSEDNKIRDQVSPAINSFKIVDGTSVQPYKGRIMNILLNIDYLMGLIKGEATKDEENRVTLKPIIEQILSSLNKCLGNVNIFRFAYVDAGNVHQITDDQVLPPGQGEEVLSSKKKQEPLPLLGERSIAKSLDIKTEVSSKLSNMIAISANSKDKSTLGSSGDNFGYINENFVDRYIPNRGEPQSNSGSLDGKIDLAVKFNNAIKSFYNSLEPDQGLVSTATSYYVDRMTKVRGDDPATRSSAMIPVSLNFKTDGISGFAMGHAFTVPDVLLPYTYTDRAVKAESSTDKVGFVVTGLDHSIEGNVWDTSVKTQMIFLKNPDDYKTAALIQRKPSVIESGSSANFGSTTPLPISQNVDSNLGAIKRALIKLGVTNKQVIIASLANAMKETGGQVVEEKINYSGTPPSRIRDIFGSRMVGLTDQQISDLTKNKQEFVERIYGVKSGQIGINLGNDKPGDGFKYIGRGFIQLTGKGNYTKYSKIWFGDDRLVTDPTKLNTVEAAAGVAAAFIKNGLERKAKALGLSEKLNSNTINQEDANLLVTSIIGGKTLNRNNLNAIFTEIVKKVDGFSKTIEKKYDTL